ncbi:N-acetylglucosaminidase [Staphylococcus aureus]|nr:N-acetylglucosaminidase [Staphylococcus aureus]MBV2711088.1 N-acetylglucosaminidase [Staphylococcus aureus]
MKKNFKLRISTLLLIVILVVFSVLLIVNETKLFKNDVNYSFDEAVSMQQGKGIVQTKEEDGKFVEANNNEIAKAMTISHKDNDMKYMDITEKVPMSESEVNVIYLVSHALVETGNGKSELAKGIKDGKKRYYNFFGIGAFDSSAVRSGKSYAEKEQWTSPDKAILGGAKFIRNEYFENNQLNLYQMRWNPENPAQHQYASDIRWADKIAKLMDKSYKQFGIKKDDIRQTYYK